jgi:methyl-accepting chemotaxis protein
MEAEQLVDEVGDDYLAGLLYAELGRIYRLYYDYPKSLDAHQKAAECYERAGKIRHRNYIWYNQSNVCRNLNDYEESERLLRMTLEAAKQEEDKSLVKLCLASLMMQYVEQGRISTAKESYQELLPLVGEEYGSAYFMGQIAKIHLSEKDYSRARQSLEKGWERAKTRIDSVTLYFSSSELLGALGKEKVAYDELMKGVALQNDEAHQALQQPVLTAQRDYLSEKLEFEAYRLYVEKKLRVLYVLILILLLLVVAFVSYLKLKKKKATIDRLGKEKDRVENENRNLLKRLEEGKKEADLAIRKLKNEIIRKEKDSNTEIADLLQKLGSGENTIEDLKCKLSEKEYSRQEMEVLVQQLENDSQKNADIIDSLRAEMESYQYENRKMRRQKVELLKNNIEHLVELVILYEAKYSKEGIKEKKIKEAINIFRKDYFAGEGEFRKVEDIVNGYFDNVMLHFRNEVSWPCESDYRRVCYMFAGVSGQIIGEIMDESKDAVYQRRSRLLKKIGKLSCNHKEMFVLLLSK